MKMHTFQHPCSLTLVLTLNLNIEVSIKRPSCPHPKSQLSQRLLGLKEVPLTGTRKTCTQPCPALPARDIGMLLQFHSAICKGRWPLTQNFPSQAAFPQLNWGTTKQKALPLQAATEDTL